MVSLKDFKTRLKIAKDKLKNNSIITNNNQNSSFVGGAFKLGTELISAVLVGTIIGFILDTWFDTKPWLIILFFFLGSIAGILNVIRVAKKMQQKDKF
jgi:ATP synthase protein I